MAKNINITKIFFQNKYVIVVLFLFFISNLNGLSSIPRVMIDEPLYSYTALKFLKTGSFYHDFFAFSGKEFCLYPFFLSLIYSIFGVSFEVGRLFSFFCGLISFLFLYLFCNENKYNDKLTAGVLSIFLCSNILFVVYRIIRPEALLSLGFTGLIFFLNNYLNNKGKFVKAKILYGLGISLGILFSTHLIGALLCINIVFYFLIFLRKELTINHIFKIFIGSLPFFLLLGYNFFDQVLNHDLLNMISSTDKFQFSFETLSINIKTVLINNYIMGIKRIYIFIFELFIVIIALVKSKPKSLIKILNLSVISFMIISFASINVFLRPYFLLIIPTIIVDLGFIFRNIKASRRLISFLFFIYLLNQLAGNIFIYKININNQSLKEINSQFVNLPDDSQYGGDVVFWFLKPSLDWLLADNIDNYSEEQRKINSGKKILWFHLPYPAHLRSSLSKEKSVFLSKETNIDKKVSLPNNIFKESSLITSFVNPNYSEIQLWDTKLK